MMAMHTLRCPICIFASSQTARRPPSQATGLNPYDMREKCKVPPLCYDFSNVATYLKRKDVS